MFRTPIMNAFKNQARRAMSSGPAGPSSAMQAARWGALVAGIWYGSNRLAELREQRPAEVAASQAALAKQMAAEAAAKAQADADFANDSILYGTDAASRQAAIVKKIMAIKESNPGNIAIASFDEAAFNGMSEADQGRLLKVMASGIGNPGSEMGCYAMGPTDYDDFYDFFKKALGRYHKVNLDEKKHSNDWELKGKEGLPADGVLDVAAFGIKEPLSMRIRTARNLKKFPLAGAMSEEDRKNMELAMGPVFDALIANPEFGGSYNSLTPGHKCHISEEKYQELVKAHIMFKDMSADSFLVDAGIASHWPQGRGCYVSEDKGFIIWVGEEDHLRIMAMKKSFKINDVFDRLKAAIDKVEDLIPGGCAKSKDFGVITSCPTNMGTGMRASVHIKIPNLTKGGSDEKAIAILKPYGLGVRGLGGEHTPIGADGTVDISPKARFCISEAEIAIALYKGVEKVMQEEAKA